MDVRRWIFARHAHGADDPVPGPGPGRHVRNEPMRDVFWIDAPADAERWDLNRRSLSLSRTATLDQLTGSIREISPTLAGDGSIRLKVVGYDAAEVHQVWQTVAGWLSGVTVAMFLPDWRRPEPPTVPDLFTELAGQWGVSRTEAKARYFRELYAPASRAAAQMLPSREEMWRMQDRTAPALADPDEPPTAGIDVTEVIDRVDPSLTIVGQNPVTEE